MAIKSKVFVSSQQALGRDLEEWLQAQGEIEVIQLVQSQSFHKKPHDPDPGDAAIPAGFRPADPQASVTLTILYREAAGGPTVSGQ